MERFSLLKGKWDLLYLRNKKYCKFKDWNKEREMLKSKRIFLKRKKMKIRRPKLEAWRVQKKTGEIEKEIKEDKFIYECMTKNDSLL